MTPRLSLSIAAWRHSTYSGVLFVAGLSEHGSLSTDSQPSLQQLDYTFVVVFALPNHPNSFHRGMFKLNAKLDVDLLLYSISHFKFKVHTAHICSLNGV